MVVKIAILQRLIGLLLSIQVKKVKWKYYTYRKKLNSIKVFRVKCNIILHNTIYTTFKKVKIMSKKPIGIKGFLIYLLQKLENEMYQIGTER